MRVLFAAVPGVGHLYPLVPLAWAFVAAGHDVRIAFAELTGKAAECGLPVVDVSPGWQAEEVVPRTLAAHPEFTEDAWQRPIPEDITPWAPLFAGVNRSLAEGALEFAGHWRPDLVVHEQVATYGLVVATKLGVPAVQRNLENFRTGRVHHEVARHLADLLDRHGVGTLDEPVATVEAFPPSLLTDEPEGWFTGEAPFTGGSVADRAAPERTGRPRIAVTTSSFPDFSLTAMRAVLGAGAGLDVDLALAGGVDTAPLEPLPPNARALGWTPYGELYRGSAAVVHHGSGGSVLAALHAGVPQLVVLDPDDQSTPVVAAAVAKRGVGIVTTADEVDAALLTRLVSDESLRAATAEVRAERAGLPTTAETAARITALVTG
ncbi:nucleotide disphospho-sugar-binding domain-containing protein [Lentzea sp. NBRC 102530]|uniref:glycosyltransferase n=1 Tax=Lentzea sp. NBRC 102530 TaxID=3032201 RepID=UPI0024A40347|nr:nucleotide disphospho-sugar-binding domain-containing protein [Lentzea sp. NBRC 102530]GLY49783.1 glycosyl transferase [Lentzea sp. NBRC 102530]